MAKKNGKKETKAKRNYNLKTHTMLALIVERPLRARVQRLCDQKEISLVSFVTGLLERATGSTSKSKPRRAVKQLVPARKAAVKAQDKSTREKVKDVAAKTGPIADLAQDVLDATKEEE